MKLLFWILLLIAVILGSAAVTHNLIIDSYTCKRCGASKENIQVTCLGQLLHESAPFDPPCRGRNAHYWEHSATVTQKGVRACLGDDLVRPAERPQEEQPYGE